MIAVPKKRDDFMRRRKNKQSRLDGPEGFMRCPHPTCRLFIPDARIPHGLDEPWSCTRGHTFTWRELEEKGYGESGGWTHAQMTCAEQGALAEDAVRALGKLGEHRIAGWHTAYGDSLDGWTDTGWGIEVKSVNAEARNLAFVAGTRRSKDRKDKTAKKRGYKGILGVLVLLDFRSSVASVYVREMKRVHYYEVAPGSEPLAVVAFDNPFTKQQRKAA